VTRVERVLLTLRVAMEIGIVAALAYWGVHTGGSTGAKILLGLGAPAVGFGFWGAVDFHSAGRLAESLRLVQELGVSLLAAVAWFGAERPIAAGALAAISIVYHALVYATGGRLLEPAQLHPTRT
jgi:Protein of unknown function (DUF2568)